ncbi:MAG: NOP5/NOP56 family protein [Methanomassiliicoccales archaeon]
MPSRKRIKHRVDFPVMILVTKWFGVFLLEGQEVKDHRLFPQDPQAMAQKMATIQKGGILPEEREMAGEGVQVTEPRISSMGQVVERDTSFIRPEDFSVDPGLLQRAMVELGKIRTREAVGPDAAIVQAIRAIDDLIETINLMSERIHEWYGLHFPELEGMVGEIEYLRAIHEHGHRERVTEALEMDVDSIGGEMEEGDLQVIMEMAGQVLDLHSRKESLESYVSDRMEDCAPNLTALVGANLGARLISLGGGLERLSRLPSSTVQLLGAEKAMFQHLRANKKPPKHGIIFQHPAVHRSPHWQRGKISRTLGSKISIAAKVDHWQGEYMGDRLREDMEARVEEVRRKYPSPPRKKRKKRGK